MMQMTINLNYGGRKVDCTVEIVEEAGDLAYEVYFDNDLAAELVANDEGTWRQIVGAPLDLEIIELIGKKIEAHYA
jgi:hypothetical protein